MTPYPRERPARMARVLLAVALLVAAAIAAAGGWRALDLPERLEATQVAFVGRVSSIDVQLRDGEPWTVVAFDVERWFRDDGRATSDGPGSVRVALWGGRAPGAPPLLVAGAPSFADGERVLLWLRAPDEGLAVPIVGVDQGVWRPSDGAWRGPDGRALGVGVGGRLELDAESVPDGLLFDALEAAFRELEGGTP